MVARLCAIITLSIVTTISASADLTIAANGRSDYQIVLGEGPTRVARVAADELQRWIAEATGVTLPIVTEADSERNQIFVGAAALPEEAGVDVETLAPEAFAVRTIGENLVLVGMDAGNRPDLIPGTTAPTLCGTMNAVYHFLERYVGVRWYWHDDLGTIVPRHDLLAIPAINYDDAPRFIYRTLPYGPQVDGEQVASHEWGRRNRLGKAIQTYHAHAFFRHLPIDEYGEQHPEYYALVNGERITRYYLQRHGGQVCTTNPDVIDIFARKCIEYFEQHPDRTMCSVSPNDGGGFCQCDDCTALDPGTWPEGSGRAGHPLMADRMMTFYNAIAEQTTAVFPDRYLGAYVYSFYSLPPERVMPHPNLALVLAINSVWRGGTPEFWANDREMIDGWAAVHDYLFMYDIFYSATASLGFPAPIVRHTDIYMKHIDDLGYHGGYLYIGPTWESLGPGSYLLARLLWDPQADADAIVSEYYADLYGAAAEQVRAYEELVEDRWVRGVAGQLGEPSAEARYFLDREGGARNLGVLLQVWRPMLGDARALLDAALAAADTEDDRARVQRVVDQFEFAEASTAAIEGIARFEASRAPDPAVTDAVREAIERRESIIERIGDSWSPHFRNWIRNTDDRTRSPLRRDAAYFALAGDAALERLAAARAEAPPIIDGISDDTIWQDAPRSMMRENMGAAEARARTTVALAFDDTAVYALFECQEPNMTDLRAESLGHDSGEIFRTDNVELLLDPGGEGRNYYHFTVNAGGSTWDALHAEPGASDVTWDGAWESSVALREDGWSVEIAIPFEALGIDAASVGDLWRINAHRTRRSTAAPDEYQALSPTLGGFHQPDRFAHLTFGAQHAPTGENILQRWDAERFEVGARGEDVLRGSGRGDYSIIIADDRAYVGQKSIKITVGDDSLATLTYYPSSVEPGNYRLAMRYYADPLGPAPENERLADLPITRIIFRDAAGNAVSESRDYSWERSAAEPAEGAWADHIHIFRTLPGTERFTVTVFIHRPGTYWIDDVSLVRF